MSHPPAILKQVSIGLISQFEPQKSRGDLHPPYESKSSRLEAYGKHCLLLLLLHVGLQPRIDLCGPRIITGSLVSHPTGF